MPASLTPLEVWAALGGAWKRLTGGRWGGDFSKSDPNHFDLGPHMEGPIIGRF